MNPDSLYVLYEMAAQKELAYYKVYVSFIMQFRPDAIVSRLDALYFDRVRSYWVGAVCAARRRRGLQTNAIQFDLTVLAWPDPTRPKTSRSKEIESFDCSISRR